MKQQNKTKKGTGVFPSEAACCVAGAAFPTGCAAAVELAPEPGCFVVDTWFPARLCRASRTLCGRDSGVNSYASLQECCSPNGPFGVDGCSARPPVSPCWSVGSFYPRRRCVLNTDVAVCNRGWGVFESEEVCCAASFSREGCSVTAAAAPVVAAALVGSG